MASKGSVLSFPAVFALGNFQIHVGSTDCSNIATNVKVSIYQSFSFHIALGIPDVNPDNHHV